MISKNIIMNRLNIFFLRYEYIKDFFPLQNISQKQSIKISDISCSRFQFLIDQSNGTLYLHNFI